MGLFSKKKELPIVRIEGPRKFALDIVGESHYQTTLDRLAGGKIEDGHKLEMEALLFLENDNPYDNKAVAVGINGNIVGYLDRETARSYREQIAAAGQPKAAGIVAARIVGGWLRENDDGHYGVKLDLPIDAPKSGIPKPEAPDAAEEERILIEMVEDTEADAARNGWGVAPGWYKRLAILYRKEKRYDDEVEILERYEAQPKAPGVLPKKLAERLVKARAIRDRNRAH